MARNNSGGLGRWVLHGEPDYAAFNPYDSEWRPDQICDVDAWRWSAGAACRNTDPEMWFETETQVDTDVLGSICRRCPVREPCLESAIAHNEYGYWAGTTRRERRALLRKHAKDKIAARRG